MYDILIVDDLTSNILFLRNIFSPQEYHIRHANNGYQALKEISVKLPDLIILDINMPEIDGYQVCQIIKSDPKTKEIPIIFLSGCDSAEDKIRAFNLGGIDYITKPFFPEEVLIKTQNQLIIQLQKNN